jgi:hypothetical protein
MCEEESVHRPAQVGLAMIGVAIALIVMLEFAYASEHTLIRRTISQHQLRPTGWVFGLAIVSLAAGSVAIAVSLVRRRLSRGLSVGVGALLAWSVGLLIIAMFPKHDWSVGPSLSGYIHRVGSVIAFVSLPIGALLIAAPWRRDPRWRRRARMVMALGAASALWVTGITVVIVRAAGNGLAWWRVMPLGAVERGLALFEVATLIALGVWAASGVRHGAAAADLTPDPAADPAESGATGREESAESAEPATSELVESGT